MGKKRAASETSDSSLMTKKPRKDTGPASRSTKKDTDGNDFWEIADKRRVTISQFKNQYLISIREYYEQNGEMKPGKKGISLTVAQYSALVEALPALEKSLKAKGQSISRPKYDAADTGGGADDEDGDEDEDEDEDEEIPDADEKVEGKKNFEETSEEED